MGIIFANEEVAEIIKKNILFDNRHVVQITSNPSVDNRVAHHCDLSLAVIGDKIILEPSIYNLYEEYLLSLGLEDDQIICGKTLLDVTYPYDAVYNVLPMKNHLFLKKSITDQIILDQTKLNIIDVNQGYARCSVLPIGQMAAITSDGGMYKALKEQGYKVLKIEPGNIALDGFQYGFIGGVGGTVEKNIIINGSLDFHPEGDLIRQFIENQSFKVVELHQGLLVDVGSILYYQR